ncbi:MAG TPA: tape measure protein, partial [Coriobacteriia bacterium]|nr:tape measure protein [Coriobacteriia bacterium]
MADRTVRVRLIAEVADFKRQMGEATRAVDALPAGTAKAETGLGRLVQSAKYNREAWTTVGTAVTAVGVAILAVGAAALKTGISYNTLQQTTRAALTTLLGSAQAANAQMDKLDDFARNSPFAKQVFITAQQQLLGFGVAATKVIPILDSMQNAVAAMGGSNDQIAAIADILARIKSEGRLSGDALQRLGYYGVDAAELIGSQMGMTSAQIRDMASKPGGIPVDQVWDP